MLLLALSLVFVGVPLTQAPLSLLPLYPDHCWQETQALEEQEDKKLGFLRTSCTLTTREEVLEEEKISKILLVLAHHSPDS